MPPMLGSKEESVTKCLQCLGVLSLLARSETSVLGRQRFFLNEKKEEIVGIASMAHKFGTSNLGFYSLCMK